MESKGFWYLATVYRKHPYNPVAAFHDAAEITGQLMKRGWVVYPAIVASHTPSEMAGLDPTDHAFWLTYDDSFLDRADGLIVAMMDNWEKSTGIAYEIDRTRENGKPIYYLDPDTLHIYGCHDTKDYPDILTEANCYKELM